jgi:hypothetical protein
LDCKACCKYEEAVAFESVLSFWVSVGAKGQGAEGRRPRTAGSRVLRPASPCCRGIDGEEYDLWSRCVEEDGRSLREGEEAAAEEEEEEKVRRDMAIVDSKVGGGRRAGDLFHVRERALAGRGGKRDVEGSC